MSTKDLKFTEKHEWASVNGNIATFGITDYAQHQFGDIVFIELPTMGKSFSKGAACANIESVKAVADMYAPVSGEVTEVNSSLENAPEQINKEPYGAGWVCKVKMAAAAELDSLMDESAYENYVKSVEEK
jgi:glycine cleavage system H protein